MDRDMTTRVRLLVPVLAVFVPAALARAQACPIVDRGDPRDGVTTATVVVPVADCSAPLFLGWRCLTVRSEANDNDAVYLVEVRFNLPGVAVRGSFTWLKGGDSTGSIREDSVWGRQVQDTLAEVDRVRTIELVFRGQGTKTPPRNGFVNISSVYADLLELLVSLGVAEGVLGHYGNSGGSMMGANALAYHRLDEVLDGVVLGGGPFWSDLRATCTDPGSPVFGAANLRETVDDWVWREIDGSTYCTDMDPSPEPAYECRSTLGSEARRSYPSLRVSVLVGTRDDPWIDASASEWWLEVAARSKSFDRPDAPHLVVDSEDGANRVYQRITEMVGALIFRDGFESGDTSAWSQTGRRRAPPA